MLKAFACAAALTVCAAGAASAAPAPAAKVTYTISFDGYCDGMTLNVYKGLYTTGNSTGCEAGAYEQGLQTSVVKFGGLVVTGNQNNAPELYTYALDLTKQTFKLYVSNGTQYALLNKGTFSFDDAKANAAGPKSTLAK